MFFLLNFGHASNLLVYIILIAFSEKTTHITQLKQRCHYFIQEKKRNILMFFFNTAFWIFQNTNISCIFLINLFIWYLPFITIKQLLNLFKSFVNYEMNYQNDLFMHKYHLTFGHTCKYLIPEKNRKSKDKARYFLLEFPT